LKENLIICRCTYFPPSQFEVFLDCGSFRALQGVCTVATLKPTLLAIEPKFRRSAHLQPFHLSHAIPSNAGDALPRHRQKGTMEQKAIFEGSSPLWQLPLLLHRGA
jgi:hypothetical protein